MPEAKEMLQMLGIVREVGVIGSLIASALILLVRDWRVMLLALLGQYVAVGFILSQLIPPEIALIKVLVGALICPMLYLAARQSGWSVLAKVDPAQQSFSKEVTGMRDPLPWTGLAFRALALCLVFVLATVLIRDYPLPGAPPDVGLSCYWLMLVGVVVLMLSGQPLLAGPGLLTALTGFELLYTLLESSLVIVFLLAGVNLLLTAAISYLAAIQGLNTLREES
ncbi:MAG: hypothetical protein ACP5R2_11515 [Anaerolineae bacterium]